MSNLKPRLVGTYSFSYVSVAEIPTKIRPKRKYLEIEAALRACPPGQALRIPWPSADNRRQWAMNVRTAMRDRGITVRTRTDVHYLYLLPKKEQA